MTLVVELRDLKKSLPRPVTHLWHRTARAVCGVRVRVACLGLLIIALGDPLDAGSGSRNGVLGMLCAVLTAAVSAATSLLCDTGSALFALFGDQSSPALGLGQKLGLCFADPASPFDICPATGAFPAFSLQRACALAACALILFGCGFGHRKPARESADR
ncbi:MAG TPA: hypothetical protein VER11_09915 [Polyangiaceae bacterium]|nr:hypothetical protein [Polyangiaceae bacterium]